MKLLLTTNHSCLGGCESHLLTVAVLQRMRANAAEIEIVRLRQPIDTECFTAQGALSGVATRAMPLTNSP